MGERAPPTPETRPEVRLSPTPGLNSPELLPLSLPRALVRALALVLRPGARPSRSVHARLPLLLLPLLRPAPCATS